MFERMPRELFKKRKIIHNKELFINYITVNNSIKDIFTNTFDFASTVVVDGKEKIDRTTIIIPHVLFDLDSAECFDDMMRLHNYCVENNIAHYINFSGRGYHVYIVVQEDPENTILDVLIYQTKLIKLLDIDVDPTCVGNQSHLIRVPGTYNIKREHWCIGLMLEELTNHADIMKLAEKQRTGSFLMPGNPLKLEHHISSNITPDNPVHDTNIDLSIDVRILIPCLRTNIKSDRNIPHQERIWIVEYLSELYRNGTPPNQLTDEEFNVIVDNIVDFLSTIISKFNRELTKQHVKGIVRNCENSPSCASFQLRGYCVTNKCWRRDF